MTRFKTHKQISRYGNIFKDELLRICDLRPNLGVKAAIKMNISSIISPQKLKYNLTWLYLDHGLVLVLQPLVHKAVLLHRQQGQGALELTALALGRPAQEFGQQVGGEPGKLWVHHTIGEPCIRSQHM